MLSLVMTATGLSAVSAQTFMCGGLHFNAGFPKGELDEQLDRNAYGIGGQLFISPQQSPLAFGVDLNWMNYGNESRREPFSTTIPDVTVKVETTNNIVQGFFVLRLGMPSGPIQPYGDGLIGFNYLFTETSIKDADDPSEEVASSYNRTDAAFAYGFGGGVMFRVYSGMMQKDRPIHIFLDCGLRYIWGGEAEYLKEGSIARVNGAVVYDFLQSRTDLMRLHVGVMGRF